MSIWATVETRRSNIVAPTEVDPQKYLQKYHSYANKIHQEIISM